MLHYDGYPQMKIKHKQNLLSRQRYVKGKTTIALKLYSGRGKYYNANQPMKRKRTGMKQKHGNSTSHKNTKQ